MYVSLTTLVGLLVAAPAWAVDLFEGDLLVTDSAGPSVVRVDPVTGDRTVVAQGAPLDFPAGIVETDRRIFVADSGAGAVIEVDPATGNMTTLASGGDLTAVEGIALHPNGQLVVTDPGDPLAPRVLWIDPADGAQSVLSEGDELVFPIGIAVDEAGRIFVTDPGSPRKVIEVDPGPGGAQSVVTSGDLLSFVSGIAIDEDLGQLLVANSDSGRSEILNVDPASSMQSIAAAGGDLIFPLGIAFDVLGDLVVADPGGTAAEAAVVRVDLSVPATSVISMGNDPAQGPILDFPNGITIVPEPGALGLQLVAGLGLLGLRARVRRVR